MITIYTTCHSLDDPYFYKIQYNAIVSWLQWFPAPQVLIMGDDPGVKEFCASLSSPEVEHVQVKLSESGVPLWNSMLEEAERRAKYDDMLYVSSDMILLSPTTYLVAILLRKIMGTYIAGLMRRPITLTDFIDFGKPDWQDWLMSQNVGKHNPGCGDYYLFSKGFFGNDMPPFTVGRGGCDGWANSYGLSKARLVDVTEAVVALHQEHQHKHWGVGPGMKDYNHNMILAGGTEENHAPAMLILHSTVVMTKYFAVRNRMLSLDEIVDTCNSLGYPVKMVGD